MMNNNMYNTGKAEPEYIMDSRGNDEFLETLKFLKYLYR